MNSCTLKELYQEKRLRMKLTFTRALKKLPGIGHVLVVMLLTLPLLSLAQNTTISGRVIDDTGEGLPGATIKELGTTNGVITDLDGKFSLSVAADARVSITFIGFAEQVFAATEVVNLEIELRQDETLLDEVVVIGYGEQRKKVATAAISTISGEDLEGFGVPNVGTAMQGQISGVVIKSGSGQPGATPNILIRGIGTNGDNNPLVIVDGMTFDNTAVLGGINPNDIESINVLKDGASTAIYGARGANGVIIVTTKKGTSEGAIEYSGTFGFQEAWQLPEVLDANQYQMLLSEKYENSGLTPDTDITEPICGTCDTDWIDQLFGRGTTENHSLSYSKGSESGNFRGSFSLFKQKGVISPEKSNYQRATVRLNSEQQVNEYVKFGTNLAYINTISRSIDENNSFGGPIATALVYDPLTPIFDSNEQFGFAQSKLVRKEYINPFSNIFLDNDVSYLNEIYGNGYVEIAPVEKITFKSDLAFTKSFSRWGGYTPSYDPLHADNSGNLTNDVWAGNSEYTRWKWENTIKYATEWKNHKLETLLGYSLQEDGGNGISASGQNLNEERFTEAWRFVGEAPDTLQRAGNWQNTKYAIVSAFGRAIYSYDNKYLFTFILRRDGSSRFGPDNRYAIFPSFSVGWVATAEEFWSVPLINFLKVRASYGENGNDRIGDNRYRSVISGGPNYQFGAGGNQATYLGFTTPFASNPLLGWETSKQIDIGLELGLMEDMISVEFDYYIKTTSDLLLDGNPPSYVGTGAPTVNVGEFQNSGIELSLGYSKRFGQVNFSTKLNVTTLKNEVTKLDGANSFIGGYTWPVRNVQITGMEVGKPVGYFRGYKNEGIFTSQADVFRHIGPDGDPIQPQAEPGDLKFTDINNDGLLNEDDIVSLGKPWADLTIGWQLNASYKGFSLSAVIFASIGSEIYRTYERQDVTNNNYQTFWLDRYHEINNPGGTLPRLVSSDLNGNQRPSDFYVESGNFLRLKNVQLSYTLPNSITQKAQIKNLTIFVSADNLLTITGYKGFEPEIGTSGWILDTAVDKGFYPLARTVSAGFSIKF